MIWVAWCRSRPILISGLATYHVTFPQKPSVHLHTPRLHLRPMTDADWGTLLRWNQDPDVLYYKM